MRTVQDFVQDCIKRGKTLQEIKRIAMATRWADKLEEVEAAFATFQGRAAA